MPEPLSYSDTAGFPQLHMSRVIDADFDTAAHRLFRWGIQRSGLFRVSPTHPVVQEGAEVTMGLGPFDFHCRVVETFTDDGRCGFTYGTLTGHVERGEETFTLDACGMGGRCCLSMPPPSPSCPSCARLSISPAASLSAGSTCTRWTSAAAQRPLPLPLREKQQPRRS